MADIDSTDLTTLTVDLLGAYFASNIVPSEQLSSLIQSTHAALAQINSPAPVEAEVPVHAPAVSIRKSLASRDHIISMVDGKPYKTLKRHLATRGMTPAEYRERYKLPADYPLVAPAYSEQRRVVAQKLGLGRSRTQAAQPKDVVADIAAPVASKVQAAPSPAKSGRKPRAASAPATPKVKPSAAVKPVGRQSARKAQDTAAVQSVAEAGAAEAPPAAKAKVARKPSVAAANGIEAIGAAASLAAPAADGAPKLVKKRKLSIAKPKAD